ncbi:MAG: MFS transporter [Pseudomonadota bacterium]
MVNNKNLLQISYFINQLGTYTSYLAIIAIAREHNNSINSIAMVLGASAAGTMVGWLLTMKYLKNVHAKLLLSSSLILSGLMMVSILCLVNWWLVVAAFFVLGMCTNTYMSSFYTLIPRMIKKTDVPNINQNIQILSQLAIVIGAILGGILLDRFGFRLPLFVDIISYLLVGVVYMCLSHNRFVILSAEKANDNTKDQEVVRPKCPFQRTLLFSPLVLAFLVAFAAGAYNVIEIPFFTDILGLPYRYIGFYFSISVLGIPVFHALVRKKMLQMESLRSLFIGIALGGLVYLVWGMQSSLWITGLLLILFSLFQLVIFTSVNNYLHAHVLEDNKLQTVFSTLQFGRRVAALLGKLAIPFIVGFAGEKFSFSVLGVIMIIGLIVVLITKRVIEGSMSIVGDLQQNAAEY